MTQLACTAAPWPTPADLINAPELAALALVAHALDVLGRVLVTVHPELFDTHPIDGDACERLSAAASAADELLVHADRVLRVIREYRAAVAPVRISVVPDDSFPF
jgi:hypothetical protein